MANIIVCGYMVRYPAPGNRLAFLPYVAGLHRLGHRVMYLETSGWPGACYNPRSGSWGDDPRAGLTLARQELTRRGLRVPLVYVDDTSGAVYGARWAALKEALAAADLLLNLGGVCWLPEFDRCRLRALVDMDPMFTQAGKFGGHRLADYHHHFSYGCNIGRAGCTVPSAGIAWMPTWPPVLLEEWAAAPGRPGAPLTTIGHWNAYGAIEWQGQTYGQKGEEFLRFIDLPRIGGQPLELALSGVPAEVARRLRAAGWSLRDPAAGVNRTARSYCRYILRSRGELSVAKNAYVKSRCGWFSDRTVCYLAAGLPAIVQDTGFAERLPAGEGLFAFQDIEQARTAIEQVNRDYRRHRAAARRIAREHFDYAVVLPHLLERAPSRAPMAAVPGSFR